MLANENAELNVKIADDGPMLPTTRRHDTQFSQDKLVSLPHAHRQCEQFISGEESDCAHTESIPDSLSVDTSYSSVRLKKSSVRCHASFAAASSYRGVVSL